MKNAYKGIVGKFLLAVVVAEISGMISRAQRNKRKVMSCVREQ